MNFECWLKWIEQSFSHLQLCLFICFNSAFLDCPISLWRHGLFMRGTESSRTIEICLKFALLSKVWTQIAWYPNEMYRCLINNIVFHGCYCFSLVYKTHFIRISLCCCCFIPIPRPWSFAFKQYDVLMWRHSEIGQFMLIVLWYLPVYMKMGSLLGGSPSSIVFRDWVYILGRVTLG